MNRNGVEHFSSNMLSAMAPLATLGATLGLKLYLARAIRSKSYLPTSYGIGATTMRSNNMEPALSAGDLLFVRSLSEQEMPGLGEIVVYEANRTLAIRRVVGISGGTVICRNDAQQMCEKPVEREAIQGIVVARAAHVGSIINMLRTPAGIIAALMLTFFAMEISFQWQQCACEEQFGTSGTSDKPGMLSAAIVPWA